MLRYFLLETLTRWAKLVVWEVNAQPNTVRIISVVILGSADMPVYAILLVPAMAQEVYATGTPYGSQPMVRHALWVLNVTAVHA